jgi:hypothetical protein
MSFLARSSLLWGLIVMSLSPIGNASAGMPDFLPRRGMCGLGRITAYQNTGQNQWTVHMADVQTLFEDRRSADDRVKPPGKMTIDMITGLGGVVTLPSDNWIGRVALFVVNRSNGRNTLSTLRLPLAPDGSPFFVFGPEPDQRPEKIREFVKILTLNDAGERLRRLYDVVESREELDFLRSYAAKQVGRIGVQDSSSRKTILQRLARWRDDSELPLGLRLVVDDVLVDISPLSYQWTEARVAFLTGVRDAPSSPRYEADHARRRLVQAQKKKEEQDR